MTAFLELCFKPFLYNIPGIFRGYDSGSESQYIGVVVFTGQSRRKGIAARSSPDTLDLVGAYGDPYPGATHDNAFIAFTTCNGFSHSNAKIGIIHPVRAPGTKIPDLVAKSGQVFLDILFQVETSVVASKSNNLHVH